MLVEQIPDGIKKSLKDKLIKKKKNIVEMEHKKTEDLADKTILYRESLTGAETGGKKINAFVVKGNESCILVQLGKTIGTLPEGFYEIDKSFQYTGTEIFWINKTEFKIKWGSSDIFLNDNIKIGAHGSLLVKITEPLKFFMNVVSGNKIVDRKQVDDFLFNLIVQTYKQVLGGYNVDDVIRAREDIKQKVQVKLYSLFDHWGISLINLELLGLKLPEKFEELGEISIEKRLQKEKLITEKATLKEKLEIEGMKSTISTQRKKAEVDQEIAMMEKKKELMKKEVEILQVKKEVAEHERQLLETDKTFKRKQGVLDAQNNYQKASFDIKTEKERGEVQLDLLEKEEKSKVAGEARIIETHGSSNIKLAEIEAHKEINIAKAKAKMETDDIFKKEQEERNKKEVKNIIARLNGKIDKFDEMLAEGKISEDTYKMRINRIEKELEKLESKLD